MISLLSVDVDWVTVQGNAHTSHIAHSTHPHTAHSPLTADLVCESIAAGYPRGQKSSIELAQHLATELLSCEYVMCVSECVSVCVQAYHTVTSGSLSLRTYEIK